MFALRLERDREVRAVRPARSGLSGFMLRRFVLPRWLRRPARVVARLCQGDITPPRYAATAMSAVLLGSFGLYGAWLGGHMPAIVQAVTARTGFAVDQIRITGHHESSEIDILDQLGLDGWTSLIGFSAEAARERIAALPWVQSVSVRKIYPDELEVKVEERTPFAIWQHDGQLTVIEASGAPIAPFSGGRHAALPLFVGEGSEKQAAAFLAKVSDYPEVASRAKGYILVAGRRWDLRLDNGVTVKLPEFGVDEALAELVKLDRENGLLSRDIVAVDLRYSDRLIVQMTPEATERRTAELAEQAKAAKKRAAEKRT